MMKRLRFSLLLCVLLAFSPRAGAQCTFRNTAFTSGEYLTYNLYYNWKFVWLKAGTASMSIVNTTYKGNKAYRASLTTRGNSRADKIFIMRDTLLCYVSQEMAPLYFRKGALEGNRYRVDEVFYSYPGTGAYVKQHRMDADGEQHWQQHNYQDCVYDMLSIFLRARSFNPANWKAGYVVNFPMVDGNNRENAQLRFHGRSKVKADNGHTYHCLELSYMEFAKDRWKEIVRFYVTDDTNHIPVRLDMFLRFGSAKAFLVSMKGNNSKVTSLVR